MLQRERIIEMNGIKEQFFSISELFMIITKYANEYLSINGIIHLDIKQHKNLCG